MEESRTCSVGLLMRLAAILATIRCRLDDCRDRGNWAAFFFDGSFCRCRKSFGLLSQTPEMADFVDWSTR